jgi:hypothetical protein
MLSFLFKFLFFSNDLSLKKLLTEISTLFLSLANYLMITKKLLTSLDKRILELEKIEEKKLKDKEIDEKQNTKR